MDQYGTKLIGWYEINKRNLPWRQTRDPYKIWLSEIILQQTRVDQGLGYYLKFVEAYPTINSLANANPDDIFKLWQGLGYYNRAQNMLETAKKVVLEDNGKMPSEYDDLIKLKGIGNYTAAAITSIAFDKPFPVVDGNVYRVLSRLFAVETPINTTAGKHRFELLASNLMLNNPPGIFNQAIMEFGALYCKPINPDCEHCIFKNDCKAWKLQKVNHFPVKLKKIAVRKRFLYYLILESENNKTIHLLLKKRIGNDIWKNLYDFPLLEFHNVKNPHEVIKEFTDKFKIEQGKFKLVDISKKYKHQLTHQQINAVFIRITAKHFKLNEAEKSVLLIDKNKIANYPVSRLIERYLQDQKMI